MRCGSLNSLATAGRATASVAATVPASSTSGGQVTAPTGPVGGHLVEQVERGEAQRVAAPPGLHHEVGNGEDDRQDEQHEPRRGRGRRERSWSGPDEGAGGSGGGATPGAALADEADDVEHPVAVGAEEEVVDAESRRGGR